MGSSCSNLLIHIVFSTKNREKTIGLELEKRLYDYIGGIVHGEKCYLNNIGGTEDHVHLLLDLKTDISLAELLRRIKGNSSKWVHTTFPDKKSFAWQKGYGAFSVSRSNAQSVSDYIDNQKEHHKSTSYRDELFQFLEKHKIKFDEKYVLG